MNGNDDQADRPELETLDGLKPSDHEKILSYLQICAEHGQVDPALWNRAVSFARRYDEKWERILAD